MRRIKPTAKAPDSSAGPLPAKAVYLTKAEVRAEKARRAFPDFVRTVRPGLSGDAFHQRYYEVLDRFARGEIRKLIVTLPPQHGKSLGSTILLPAYLLGRAPQLRIAVASYNLSLASRFNRQIQRLMDTKSYRTVFPDSRIKTPGSKEQTIRTAEEFEVAGHPGGVISVGREGALTGNSVDVMIIDDLYR